MSTGMAIDRLFEEIIAICDDLLNELVSFDTKSGTQTIEDHEPIIAAQEAQ